MTADSAAARADAMDDARRIIDEAGRDAEIGKIGDQAFWPETSVAVARAFLAQARLIEEARELHRAAENYIRCQNSPSLSPYIKENGLYGTLSPWSELRAATEAFLITLPAKRTESAPTREEMRKVLAAVANAHRLIRGDCPGAAGDVLRAILQSTSAYQVPATERVDG